MKSMTGYGTATGAVGKGELYIEIKSINHRYNEINFRIPGKMGLLESKLRKVLQKHFPRGKIEVYMREKTPLFGGATLQVNMDLAKSYQKSFHKLKSQFPQIDSKNFLNYVAFENLVEIQEKEGSYEKLWRQIDALCKKAVAQVEKMRIAEGKHTKVDQTKRLKLLAGSLKKIKSRSKASLNQHFERVKKRVRTASHNEPFDDARLQAEAAFLSGRQDIAEELTRLESHVSQYRKMMQQKGPVGRKLDFLIQEMNREINTIGAKASDAQISNAVVDSKAELERLREQVQNVE